MVWSYAEADMHEAEQAKDEMVISTQATKDEAKRQRVGILTLSRGRHNRFSERPRACN